MGRPGNKASRKFCCFLLRDTQDDMKTNWPGWDSTHSRQSYSRTYPTELLYPHRAGKYYIMQS